MRQIVTHHHMRNFADEAALHEWLSKFHVLNPYLKQVAQCWQTMKEYKQEAHTLDYYMQVYKMASGKYCLKIKKVVKPRPTHRVTA